MTTKTILSHPSEEQLATAVQDNLFALFRTMATLPDSEIVESDRVSYHLTFPSNPMFKGVWKTHLSEDEAEVVIDNTIEWFKAHNAPFFFWWTGLGSSPSDLGDRLMARGMISMETQSQEFAPGIESTSIGAPGMVADLNSMNETTLSQVPAGFTIKEVYDETDLHDFKRVFIEGYQMPEWAAQGWVDASLRIGIGKTPWKMYLGRLDGNPVATNILFNGGGVASVYGVATIPSARGKGVGGAITLKPLLHARDMGYRHAVLFASEMGIHAYERIGFRMVNTRINRYLWRNT